MAKTTITKREYHALCGLMVLAKRHNTALAEIEKAAFEITGETPSFDDGTGGHCSDETHAGRGEPNADELLSRLKITVEESA